MERKTSWSVGRRGGLELLSNRHANFGLLSDGDVTGARIESPRRKPPLDEVHASCTASHATGKDSIASTGSAGGRRVINQGCRVVE